MPSVDRPIPTPFSPYQRRLVLFLSAATFFEGYDLIAITQVLPDLRAEFELSKSAGGLLVAGVNVGAIAAWLLVRRADRWGRRRLLAWTIGGYTLFTVASGLAPDATSFGLAQLLARTFLLAEWAVAMMVAAEEFPADRRGFVIGLIQAFSSVGSILCAALTPTLLATGLGWRAVYFVGVIPLLLLAWARRHLRETRRFVEQVAPSGDPATQAFGRILRGPYGRRVLMMGVIWMLIYACTQNAITFWKEFAVAERGFSDADVGRSVGIAAIAALPLVFGVGTLLDRIGRRRGTVVVFGVTALGVFGCYSAHSPWLLTACLALGVFGATGVLPVLSSFNSELFPTALRGEAYGWANNGIGRIGHVLSPALLGFAAESIGWGAAVRATAILPILAAALVIAWLPETAGRELEETSALGSR
jgi:MFS transporter, putative metabolite:H+ symporter